MAPWSLARRDVLCQDFLNHLAMHIGQAEVPALETESQSGVIDSQQMQDRGLKVVDGNGILNGLEAEIVGSSVSHAWLDPSTCHPDSKCVWMVIAAPGFDFLDFALKEWSSAKFAAPDDERFIEQATAF